MNFKRFLLNEQKAYLGQKVGDILTATQELRDDAKNMGSRDLIRFSEKIVSQIRRILHSNWAKEETKNLKVLQKVAVALMKAIEEKEDLKQVVSGVAGILEKLSSDLGLPVNKLATSDESEVETRDDTGISNTEKSSPQPTSQSLSPPSPNVEAGYPALGNSGN